MRNIPNCVPEYYNEMEESGSHEAEILEGHFQSFERNREYIEEVKAEGGTLMAFDYPDGCDSCPYGEDKPVTFREDDFPGILCKRTDHEWCLRYRVWNMKKAVKGVLWHILYNL